MTMLEFVEQAVVNAAKATITQDDDGVAVLDEWLQPSDDCIDTGLVVAVFSCSTDGSGHRFWVESIFWFELLRCRNRGNERAIGFC